MVGLRVEELETELESLKEKIIELKELVDNLLYLMDEGDLHPDVEEIVSEIRGVLEDLEV